MEDKVRPPASEREQNNVTLEGTTGVKPARLSLLSLLLCSLPVGLRPPLKHLYLADRPLTAEREERGHSRDLKHDLGTNQISE